MAEAKSTHNTHTHTHTHTSNSKAKMKFSSNHSSLVLFAACIIFGTASFPTKVYSFVTKEKISPIKKTINKDSVKTIHHAVPLGQYAPAVAALFGNMITPAAILGGAIIPISFASGLDFIGDKDETKFAILLRKVFQFASVASLASFIVSVLWATTVVNQLTENPPAMAASVWHLLQRDYKLQWAAVNSHFVLGMFGYMWLIGTKAYFMGGKHPAVFGLAMSGMMFMLSIVNRAVAKGGGSVAARYGSNVFGLLSTYTSLLFRRARESFGPLEFVAVGIFIVSSISYAKYVWNQIQN